MKFYGAVFSMIDYPNELGLTIFTKGCNVRCPICHNPSLVIPPADIEDRALTEDDVAELVEEKWVTGICVTGGEPTIHADLVETLGRLKDRTGAKVKLDTNGVDPMMRMKCAIDVGVVDFVAMDVKAPLDDRLDPVIGKPGCAQYVDASIGALKDSGVDHHFRTVCVPKFLSPEDVGEIAKGLAPFRAYMLLPFDPHDTLDPAMQNELPASHEYMKRCLAEARKYGDNCCIVGSPDV